MSKEVKIFSCNKIGWLKANGIKEVGYGKDDELCYAIFNMDENAQRLMGEYYNPDSDISKFLRAYNEVRQAIKNVQEE